MTRNMRLPVMPAKIAVLEEGYEGLKEEVGRLNRSIEDLARETRGAFASLSGRLSDAGRTQWSTLAAWIGVFITIGGLALWPIYDQTRLLFARQEANIASQRDSDRDFAAMRERVRALERKAFPEGRTGDGAVDGRR